MEICREVELLIGPAHTRAFKEIGIPELAEGNRFTNPEEDDDDDRELWERQVLPRYRPRLRAALAKLSPTMRVVVEGRVARRRRSALAAEHGVTVEQVDALNRAGLELLRQSVGPFSQDEEAGEMKDDTMKVRAAGRVPVASATSCAYEGCHKALSGAPSARPELAPFCKAHRISLTRRVLHAEGAGLPSPVTALATKASDVDRRRVEELVRDVATHVAQIVEVTPSLAVALLERNRTNRPVSQGRVDVFAQDMLSGAWLVNNQGIGLGADGQLYDGQHRLLAVVRCGRSVKMLVVRGLPLEARATIDQGRPRAVGDTLAMLDGLGNAKAIVSWLGAIELLLARRPIAMSPNMARQRLSEYEESVKWFVEHGPRGRPYNRASIIGALVYAHRVEADRVEAFTRQYATGANLPEDSPILALRDHLAGARKDHKDLNTPRMLSLRTLRCLLAYMRDERLDRVAASEEAFDHFRRLHERLRPRTRSVPQEGVARAR